MRSVHEAGRLRRVISVHFPVQVRPRICRLHVVVIAMDTCGLPPLECLLTLIFVVILDNVQVGSVDLISLGRIAFDRIRPFRLARPQSFFAVARANRYFVTSLLP